MIQKLVSILYNVTQAHKEINSFMYDIPSKYMGNGETVYPLFMLNEPVRLEPNNGVIQVSFDVEVVTNEEKPKVENQEKCERIAKEVLSYLENYCQDYIRITSYNFLTLSRYNDDSTDGVSLTITAQLLNDFNYCVEDAFDPNKRFESTEYLPDINVENAQGCNNMFRFKLPNI